MQKFNREKSREEKNTENLNGKKVFVQHDITDGNGRVYIAKGKCIILDPVHIEKLKRLGVWEQIEDYLDVDNRQGHYRHFKQEIEKTNQRYNGVGKVDFSKAIKDIHELIFEEESFSKYPHLLTLAEHNEWYYTHSINVAILSVLLARGAGFDENKIKEIAIGAILHDIGLIFIDKEILYKHVIELTTEEIILIEKHTTIGAMSVRSLKIPYKSEKIIEQHHERLDGTGFPKQLKEWEIFDEAQIVAIVDELDMTTSYKGDGSEETIAAVITRMYNSPEHYNRKYVEVLKNVLGVQH